MIDAINVASTEDFTVGPFGVYPRQLRIDGPAGSEQLQPRIMAVLVALARRPGDVVTRDELTASVWLGRVVSDDALNRCIAELRRVLRSDASPDPIVTLPRVGYRLTLSVAAGKPAHRDANPVAPTTPEASVAWLRRPRNVWLAAGVLIFSIFSAAWWRQYATTKVGPLTSIAQRPTTSAIPSLPAAGSIGVLPFANLTGDPANEFLSDGISAELIDQLAAIPEVNVMARNSSFSFKGSHFDMRTIGERLRVRQIVDGSVRREGNRLRIAVQLIDAVSGLTLWSRTFEREFSGAFKLQRDISDAVTQQLRVVIPVTAGKPPTTPNPAAYEDYLRGRFAFQRRRDAASVAAAIRSFEESVRRDPTFAMSHALLAASLAVLPSYSETADLIGTFDRAQAQAQQALVLDPQNAMAYAVLGYCALGVDPLLAERNLQHSLSLAPNSVDARHWYHLLLVSVGRLNAGIDEGERALALDPVSAPLFNSLAEAYFLVGKLDMAQTYARRSQAMGIADINQVLSKLALQRGDIEGSVRLSASDDQDNLEMTRLIQAALLDSKAVPAARQALETAMRKEAWPARGWSQLNMRLLLGDLDGALSALDELEHKLGPERALQYFLSADLWDPQSQIRAHYGDPRFQELLKRTRLLAYYRETGTTPDLCRWADAEMRCAQK